MLALIEEQPDLTLDEMKFARMRKQRISGSRTSVWRFFKRHDITFKKKPAGGGAGVPAPTWRGRVGAGCVERGLFDPARLVFIDETAANTKMMRVGGRCVRGERLIGRVPNGHWKTITFVGALRCNGASTAPCVIDGAK